MGDTRISVSLILKGNKKSIVTFLPADSPLCEVAHRIKTSVLSGIHGYSFNSEMQKEGNTSGDLLLSIYDCTLNPPKDMTPFINEYRSQTGPNSITLHTLNWFPSAKLVIFESGDDQARTSVLNSSINVDEDFQYNLPSSNSTYCQRTNTNGVKLASEGVRSGSEKKMLPSEIFQAVEGRFDGLENITNASHEVSKVMSKLAKKRTEEERQAQIDSRLKRLDTKSKHSKVSTQVKRMLIKSRADGDKQIRMENRFYLETVVIDDSNGNLDDSTNDEESAHCFYGRSNNVGKIVSSALRNFNLDCDRMAELLVVARNKEDRICSFMRLPNTMPIYEAENSGHIKIFDRVIIRVYNRLEDRSSHAFADSHDKTTSQQGDAMSLDGDKDDESQPRDKISVGITGEVTNVINPTLCMSITNAIDEHEKKKKKSKKNAATTEKVKQILLKGKAKGNKKIRDVDRFYLEVVCLNKEFKPTIYPVFLSVYDPIKEVSKCVNETLNSFTLLIEGQFEDSEIEQTYNAIPIETRCIDLKKEGLLDSFKRVILLLKH
jgi:hypothetical protein